MYNLVHNVKLPTAVANNISSLIDVMIINSLYYDNTTEVLDLGYSDLWAQILHIKTDNPKPRPVIVRKRQFTEKSLALLLNELWEDIFLRNDVTTAFNAFMSTFLYYFKEHFL